MDCEGHESVVENSLKLRLHIAAIVIAEQDADLEPNASLGVIRCEKALRIIEVSHTEE